MFKRIGLIIAEAAGPYQTEFIKGVNSMASNLGYDVLVFGTFVKQSEQERYELGERNIFSLINFDMLDGVIVAGDTLKLRGLKEKIFPRLLNECKCPVVFADYINDMGFENITTDDTFCYEEIVDHLIEVHGCHDILFFSGSYEVSTTQTRFEGYKKSLAKHNIELNPDFYTFEGDFWIDSGKQVARDIIDGRRPRPDAITFCGDTMAVAALEEFQAAGWKIPEDIIITGYDAFDIGLRCRPPLTSYSPPVASTGSNAVIKLDSMINNCAPKAPAISRGRLEIGGSCGCCEDFRYTKRIYYKNETSLSYDDFLYSNMMEDLNELEDFEDLLKKIIFFLYLIPEWQSFYMCLCDNWLDGTSPYDDPLLVEGYTDEIVLHINAQREYSRYVHEPFDKKIMLPALYEEREKPTTFFFIPLHINQKCLGYSVLSYGSKPRTFDINYMNWTKHICNALEYYRLQYKLSNLAFVDILTGAYTRAGIQKNIKPLLDRIDDEKNRFLVLVVDLDRLKTINDTYGHQCGDMAIHETARVLHSVCDDIEICARTGGDEFVILGCGEYQDDKTDDLINKINAKINRLNRSKKLDFTVSVSIGGVLRKISEAQDIDELYHDADRNMYKMKEIHHKNN